MGSANDVDSAEGQELIEESFPAGANAPTNIVVTDEAKLDAVRAAVAEAPGRGRGQSRGGAGPDRASSSRRRSIRTRSAPRDSTSCRESGKRRMAPAATASSSAGPTAEEYDLRQSAARDNRLVVPIALVLVMLILMALLRAVVAPLILIATVILSYGAAMGIATFFFENVFDFPGLDPTLPLFAFIFLVALGIDYNIFLMTRVREETAHPRHPGGHASRPGRDRDRDHLGGNRARGHLLGSCGAAARQPDRDRIHDRHRRLARHVRGPDPAGARPRARDRRPGLVAVVARPRFRHGLAEKPASEGATETA